MRLYLHTRPALCVGTPDGATYSGIDPCLTRVQGLTRSNNFFFFLVCRSIVKHQW